MCIHDITTSPMAKYGAVNPRRYDVKAYMHYFYDASSDRCGILPYIPLFSALATCCFTLITLSGLSEIESMPASTRKAANSG